MTSKTTMGNLKCNGLQLGITNVSTTPVTLTTSDNIILVDTSALAITLNLPSASTTGITYFIKDNAGNAGTLNITIETVGEGDDSELIDDSETKIINGDYVALTICSDGTKWNIL
jgi:hypothetical protein